MRPCVPNTKPLTPEWFKYRSTRITASDACQVVAGYVKDPDAREQLSKYGTPLTTYERLTATDWERPVDETPSKPAIYGQWAERMIIPWFEHDMGKTVTPARGIVQHLNYDYLCCTLDGHVEDENAVFEMKAPSPRHHSIWKDGVNLSHQIQMQVQMMCCDAPHGYYAVLVWPDLFVSYMRYDLKLARQIKAALKHFMSEHVEKRVPPPAINPKFDANATSRLTGYERGEIIQLPTKLAHESDRFDELVIAAKQVKREQDEIKLRIREAMGSANKATLPDDSGWTVTSDNKLQRRAKK